MASEPFHDFSIALLRDCHSAQVHHFGPLEPVLVEAPVPHPRFDLIAASLS
jgi:hypothetical protein